MLIDRAAAFEVLPGALAADGGPACREQGKQLVEAALYDADLGIGLQVDVYRHGAHLSYMSRSSWSSRMGAKFGSCHTACCIGVSLFWAGLSWR